LAIKDVGIGIGEQETDGDRSKGERVPVVDVRKSLDLLREPLEKVG
jgi:hypothetical protein